MMYRPPGRSRRPLIPPWLMSLAVIAITVVAAWLAGPDARTGVVITGVVILVAYLGFVYYVRRRGEDDSDL